MSFYNKISTGITVAFSILFFSKCQSPVAGGVQLDIAKKPFERLSEYRFFIGEIKNLQPNDGLLPYDLNTPLFTDYAKKSRFVWMPKNTSAVYREGRALDFPAGAVLIKNFFYENDETDASKGRRIIETRLLVHRKNGWDAMAYVWNDEQTEAYLNLTGDIKKVNWTDKKGQQKNLTYLVPNRNQCKSCHYYDGQFTPIGPKAHQLNRPFPFAEGEKNQLVKWAEKGYLSGLPPFEKIPKAAQWDRPGSGTLHERAMSYLDSNCSHCHNPNGAANTSGLTLTYDQKPGIGLGIFKSPVATGKGSGGRAYGIVPGRPEESILVYRMESTDPGAMMPELGRQSVHEEGVALIREWIAGMKNENEK